MPTRNFRETRERRYDEAVARQAKFNELNPAIAAKNGGRNMCEKGTVPNHPVSYVKPVKMTKVKKERKRKVSKKTKKVE
jgi:hypothetical protein